MVQDNKCFKTMAAGKKRKNSDLGNQRIKGYKLRGDLPPYWGKLKILNKNRLGRTPEKYES